MSEKYLLDGEESPRLRFRKMRRSDFEAWLPFYHDKSSTRYWSGLPEDPMEACREQFHRIFQRYEAGSGGMNALIEKSNGHFVGLAGLLWQRVDGEEELEIAYSLLPEFRGKGYATEAARHCKSYAFANKLAPYLISIIQVDNQPSQMVALRNGMYRQRETTYKDNPVYIYRVEPVDTR